MKIITFWAALYVIASIAIIALIEENAEHISATLGIGLNYVDVSQQILIAFLGVGFAIILREAYERLKISRFGNVFGRSILNGDYFISIPTFQVSEAAERVLLSNGLRSSKERFSPKAVEGKYKAGDIPEIIASSDLLGAALMLETLGRYTRSRPNFKFSENLFENNLNFFAFGLQTNLHTPRFLEIITQSSERNCIYSNEDLESSAYPDILRQVSGIKSLISVEIEQTENGLSADLIIKTDNFDYKINQSRTDNWNFGVIIIVRRVTQDNRQIRQVCCAGAGHGGTSGASYFLANNWKTYDKQFKKFDGVFSITVTKMRAGDQHDKRQPELSNTMELCRFGLQGVR